MRGALDRAARPRRSTRCCPAGRPRAGAARARAEPPAYEQPQLELGRRPRRGRCRSAGSATRVSRPTGAARYRFYLERAAAAARAWTRPSPRERPPAGPRARCCAARVVHELLEQLDFAAPARARARPRWSALRSRRTASRRAPRTWRTSARWSSASPARSCARASRRAPRSAPSCRSRSRSTPPGAGGRSLLVNGVVDVHADEGDGLLVVDYKSDALGGREPEELCGAPTATQRLVYALAALRAGAERWRSCTASSSAPDDPAVALYGAADAARLEARAARGWPAAWWRAASSPPPSRTASLCGLPRPGRALLLGRANLAEPGALRLSVGTPSYIWRVHATLLHRAAGSDQSRSRERRPRSAPAAARRGRARLGRRDPRRRARRCTTPRPSRSSTTTTCRCSPRGTPRSRSASRSPTRSSCSARSARLGDAPARGAADRRGLQGRGRLRGRGERGAGAHTVLPWLSHERLMELAAEAVELYCWDRLGSDN